MPHYQSFDPKTEIIGQSAYSLIANIMHEDIAGILEKHGLAKIEPAEWYSLQSVLDVLSDIAQGENASSTLISIGMAAAQLTYDHLTDDLKRMPLFDFLTLYTQLYQARMRYGDPGWVKVEKQSKDDYMVTMKIPYPDDVFYGIFYTYTRLFRPANRGFIVRYDDQIQRREDGGEVTVLQITLKA